MAANDDDVQYIRLASIPLRQLPPNDRLINVNPATVSHDQLLSFNPGPQWTLSQQTRADIQQYRDQYGNLSQGPLIASFVRKVLQQGLNFAITELGVRVDRQRHPQALQGNIGVQPGWREKIAANPASDYPVQVIGKRIDGDEWYARLSNHRNQAAGNSASFGEFRGGLGHSHSQEELAWAGTVIRAQEVMTWTVPDGGVVDGFRDAQMDVFDMVHGLPPVVHDRIFSEMVISADVDDKSFIVISIPVEIGDFHDIASAVNQADRQPLRQGLYTSVEYVSHDPDTSNISWVMATSSDPGGKIPKWLQKQQTPKSLIPDVKQFIQYVRRHGNQPASTGPPPPGPPPQGQNVPPTGPPPPGPPPGNQNQTQPDPQPTQPSKPAPQTGLGNLPGTPPYTPPETLAE